MEPWQIIFGTLGAVFVVLQLLDWFGYKPNRNRGESTIVRIDAEQVKELTTSQSGFCHDQHKDLTVSISGVHEKIDRMIQVQQSMLGNARMTSNILKSLQVEQDRHSAKVEALDFKLERVGEKLAKDEQVQKGLGDLGARLETQHDKILEKLSKG
jgi:hypothetical protein